ncbi:hypothetical protein TrCOL_g4170 [Triparma columacea]|uniref:BTB domain-containing protein n=1 Tax=Triparma columacea TaxID=722753 RepID=A0A9W7GNU1_9STRA|nr:hypothetical protein TrCOL_g4170 [Triparma columacea]
MQPDTGYNGRSCRNSDASSRHSDQQGHVKYTQQPLNDTHQHHLSHASNQNKLHNTNLLQSSLQEGLRRSMSSEQLFCSASTSLTYVNTVSGSHRWKIMGVAGLDFSQGACTRSSSFTVDGESFFLELYPGGSGFGTGKELNSPGVYMFYEGEKEFVYARISMFLIRNGRRVQFSGLTTKIKQTAQPASQRWAYGDSIRRESLTDPSCGFLAPDGSVTIEVDVAVYDQPVSVCSQDMTLPKETLSEDLGGLLESGKFSDVRVLAGEGGAGEGDNTDTTAEGSRDTEASSTEEEEPSPQSASAAPTTPILAHKSILSARCPYFSQLLDAQSPLSPSLTVPNATAQTLRYLIAYIYSEQISQKTLEKEGPQLLRLANECGIKRLVIICEKFLLTQLSVHNAVDLLMLAQEVPAVGLKEGCLEFISNRSSEVMALQSWSKFVASNPELVAELFANVTGARKRNRSDSFSSGMGNEERGRKRRSPTH